MYQGAYCPLHTGADENAKQGRRAVIRRPKLYARRQSVVGKAGYSAASRALTAGRKIFFKTRKLFEKTQRLTDRKAKEEERMNADALQKKVEEQILDSYEAMYRLAYTYVRNEEDALDIVQESVYKAIRYSGRVQKEAYIHTWLWRIVMNTAIDFIRRNRREIALEETQETGKEDIYQDFDTLEALKALDERERTVIVLRFFEDLKLEDIAKILDENISTVKTVLYRSLKKLKVRLTEGEMLYEG